MTRGRKPTIGADVSLRIRLPRMLLDMARAAAVQQKLTLSEFVRDAMRVEIVRTQDTPT